VTSQSHSSPNSIRRDGVVYLAAALVQRGLPFLALLFLTRLLDPGDVGRVGVALSIANLLAMALPLGLNFGILRLFFDEPPSAVKTRWAMLLRVQIAITAVLSMLVLATGPWWSQILDEVAWPGPLLPAVAYGAFLAIQATAQGVLRAERRSTAFATVAIGQAVIGTAMGFSLARGFGPAGYMYGLAGGALAGAVCSTVLVRRPAAWDKSVLVPAALLSLPFLGHALCGWVMSLSDRILIERNLGVEAAGEYLVLYTLGIAAFLVFDAVQTAWTPVYFSYSRELKEGYAAWVVMRATMLGAALAGMLLCVAPAVLLVIAPDDYSDNLPVLGLLAISAAVRPAYLVAVTQCMDHKDSRRPALSSVIAATISIALNVALLPLIGLVAAGVASALAFGTQSFLVHRAAARHDRQPASGILVATWVGWSVLYLALTSLPSEWWGSAIRVATLAALAVVAIVAARSLRDSGALLLRSRPEVHPSPDV
jgi:O-antigen/teichoic acid export membrane protein